MRTILWAVLAALTAACASGGGPGPIEPPAPPVQAMAVVVHDFTAPGDMVEGVFVDCGEGRQGTTNGDGYVAFNTWSGRQVDCALTKDGYLAQTASHVPTPEDATLETWVQKAPPPKPTHPGPLEGRVRLEGGCFRDDTGCVLPVYAHAGDLFSLFTRDSARAEAELDKIAAAGYHGARVWSTLGGNYWRGREVGDYVTPEYMLKVDQFFAAFRARGLRLVWSQGDIGYMRDRRGTMTAFAQRADSSVVDLIDCGNEAWQTGEPDPNKLAQCVGWYATAGGQALKSLTSADGAPNFEDINKWSVPPADLFDVHSWRGGHSWDKRRHIWSYGYKGEGSTRLPFGVGSEPPGSGDLVSVTSNKHELDDEAVALLAVASMTGRQAFVWFSGEGVIINRGLETEAGFWSVPRAMALLPKDVMTYETSHHSGDSWRGRRVLVAQGEVRIDGRLANDGRFAYVIDGPAGRYALRVERSFEGKLCDPGTAVCADVSRDAGQTLDVEFRRGRLLVGRVR